MAKRFGVMLDMSRNAVMLPEEVKRFARILKDCGYNMIQLYTEDTYEVEGEPYFGYMRGRYSMSEMKDIVDYCSSIGMEVIPCVQTLAHLSQIFSWREYRRIRDVDDIMLADEERTYRLIENMFRTLRKCFTTEYVHIGMDEAHMLGLGKYLDLHGPRNRFDILHDHLERVIAIAKQYGFTPIMWSDMFFRLANHGDYYVSDASLITPEVVAACPDGVEQVYWDYYSSDKRKYDVMLEAHAKFKGATWFAGGAWTWTGFGSLNGWTLDSMTPAMLSCKENGVENIFITLWGDDGKECSYFSVLPSLFAIRRIYDGEGDMEKIKRAFKETVGEDFDRMMLLDLPMDFDEGKVNDNTPSKYLLYSDCFLGYLDPILKRSFKREYESLADRLDEAGEGSAYRYIFRSHASLCRTLALKHDLGKRTLEAYRSGDKQAVFALVPVYEETILRLERFIADYRALWFKENKPHGFDVQELRLGGTLLRLRSQKERLQAYAAGETDEIAELEDERLPYMGHGAVDNRMPMLNLWSASATPNRL